MEQPSIAEKTATDREFSKKRGVSDEPALPEKPPAQKRPRKSAKSPSDKNRPVAKTKQTTDGEDGRVRRLALLDWGRNSRIADLVERIEPRKTRHDVVLSAENVRVFLGLIEEFRRGDTLRRHALPVRSRLLFCGPPGCGKTLTAEIFAHELGLDLLVVRLDAVISSFLGETATNIRSIFEATERVPCVVFFDEFDALARARADGTEHNELRRVVNSLLMLIDRFKGRGFLIAATNLEESLDGALWRRFDDVVYFDQPSKTQIRKMLALKTKNFPAAFDLSDRADDLAGMSYADIERICIGAIKKAVLDRRRLMSEKDFAVALLEERRRKNVKRRVRKAFSAE